MLSSGKLGFWGLTALVLGLVVGVGIYNLPQNMALSATPQAVLPAWLITGAGIVQLVIAFQWLSTHYPQYNAGLYQYAQAGFGNFAGFNIAWGYWLCAAFSNVTYAVMLNDSVGAFFPVLLKHSWQTVVFASAFIWLMFFIVARGLRTAKFVNNLLTLIKVLMLAMIIIIFIIAFKGDVLSANITTPTSSLGSTWQQIRSVMMVTLFCFFGVEGAVMMSARAKRPKDVGRAGVAGFIISLVLYLAVGLLCYGLMSRAGLASLQDPSIAYILRSTCGEWAYWFVICALIISLVGGWVAWTLVVAQVPYEAAVVGILPPVFKRTNRHGMPAFGLAASSMAMELFLLLVIMADDVYMAALHITGLMIIPCYLFTALYLLKVADTPKIRTVAILALIFCLWMAYAGGLLTLMMTSIFYLAGIGFFIEARREHRKKNKAEGKPVPPTLLSRKEKIALAVLILVSIASAFLIKYLYFA